MQDDLVIQRPEASPTQATELLLLFHGVGSSAEDLRALGEALAVERPGAWVVSVRSPHRSEFGAGWQWFSVQGVTEENRPARVAAALPAFLATVRAWQRETGVDAAYTTLIGFSQGAIMALASTQAEGPPGSTRVIAIAGRFAQPPHQAPMAAVHLMHGEQDRVIPIDLAVDADRALRRLGAESTLDRFASLGHGIDARVVETIARKLAKPSPRATWLHLGDEELVVRRGQGEQHLDLGTARVARDFFRHDPPTAQEIELAIDFVEDQLMRLGPQRDNGNGLRSRSEALQPWADVGGSTLAVETVEQWFERLTLAALGQTGALDGLPPGRKSAAALLVLREFMHHRGHPSISVIKPPPALSDHSEAA
jgi:phospholipase/carboxylesterase